MSGYNFAAGPSALPEPVWRRAREELFARDACGACLLERPFSGDGFRAVAAEAEARLRELLAVPEDYAVLFLAGGAMAQFGLLPMNLLGGREVAAYVDSGYWAGRAMNEAAAGCRVHVAARAREEDGRLYLPPPEIWDIDPHAAYCHYTANETAQGLEFHRLPPQGPVPLVADTSSSILSRPVDVAGHGAIYASAQKNIGPAGLTLVIVRRDLLARAADHLPGPFSYRVQAREHSLYSTPPMFEIALANLVFEWLLEQGGVTAMAAASAAKSAAVYAAIDRAEGFYRGLAARADRSRMNVCFHLADAALTERFLADAEAAGLHNLKGHGRVGGVRASLYNALPPAGAQALAAFMDEFARCHG